MAVYDDLSDNDRIRVYDVGVSASQAEDGPAHALPVTYRTGDITSPYVDFIEPLLVQDSHFIDCIRTGRRPQTSGERGLGIVKALAASDKAAATGVPVRIGRHRADGVKGPHVTAEVAS
jgi:predicted dehydrogenase